MLSENDFKTYLEARNEASKGDISQTLFNLSVGCDLAARGSENGISKEQALQQIEICQKHYENSLQSWRKAVNIIYG